MGSHHNLVLEILIQIPYGQGIEVGKAGILRNLIFFQFCTLPLFIATEHEQIAIQIGPVSFIPMTIPTIVAR